MSYHPLLCSLVPACFQSLSLLGDEIFQQHLCISIQDELELSGQSNFLFTTVVIFLYMGILRGLMSDLRLVCQPIHESQLPKWITSFLSAPGLSNACAGLELAFHQTFPCPALHSGKV